MVLWGNRGNWLHKAGASHEHWQFNYNKLIYEILISIKSLYN